jgi:hypothetical protein
MKPDLLLRAFDLSVNVLPLYAVEHADSLVCFCFGRPNMNPGPTLVNGDNYYLLRKLLFSTLGTV